MVTLEHTAGIFPGDGAACLDLGPRQLAVVTATQAALCYQIIDATLAVLVAGIPVLHGAVLDFGSILDNNLYDGSVQLILVTHRRRAALQIRHVGIIVGHDERALKLACLGCVNTEIGGQFHRAPHAFGDIDKRAITEYSRIQCSIKIIGIGHHFAQVLAHQVRIVLHRLADGAEYDAQLGQTVTIGRLHAHAVHNCIHSHTAQAQLFLQGNTQLVKSLLQLGVNVLGTTFLCLTRCSIVADGLIVNFRHMHMAPCRSLQRQPMAVCFQAELQQPFRLSLQGRDAAHHILIKPLGDDVGLDIGHKAVLVLRLRRLLYNLVPFFRFFNLFHRSNELTIRFELTKIQLLRKPSAKKFISLPRLR